MGVGRGILVTHPDLRKNFRPLFSRNLTPPPQGANDFDDNFFGGRGHGTHVSGIIAATPEYPPFTSLSSSNSNSGVTGSCWGCSLGMFKFDGTFATLAPGITSAVDRGHQAVNISYGDDPEPVPFLSCASAQCSSTCSAIAYATQRDVVVVGASGNRNLERIQFPARDVRVIAVGGLESDSSFWDTPLPVGGAEPGSNFGPEQAVVAPARQVLSTVYPNFVWNPIAECGDDFGPPIAGSVGYGTCTGTSMSAPHVTALVGLLRSADPLRNRDQVKSVLTSNTQPCVGPFSERCGAGFPDAAKAVTAALGGSAVVNRLTPLFSFYGSVAEDHFYTTVPQMASAALTPGGLQPQPAPPINNVSYDAIGLSVPGYASFPWGFSPPPAARAIASIFTTHKNPYSSGPELAPLYRLSYRCGDEPAPNPICTPSDPNYNPSHISHFYTTDAESVKVMSGYDINGLRHTGYPTGVGYRMDGIEGYVYPTTQAQPRGTVKLCRKYDYDRDDWVVVFRRGDQRHRLQRDYRRPYGWLLYRCVCGGSRLDRLGVFGS